jgi:hypothetical protein
MQVRRDATGARCVRSEEAMSYYDEICGACPGKAFINPETGGHDGTGYEFDGSRAADGARRDADHKPAPLPLRGEEAQRKMFDAALDIIRRAAPDAVTVDLKMSDQDLYGFVLQGLVDAAGNQLLPGWSDTQHPLAGLEDEVADLINDLEWDGVVGEDECGYASIRL